MYGRCSRVLLLLFSVTIAFDCTRTQVLKGTFLNYWQLSGCTRLVIRQFALGKASQLFQQTLFENLLHALGNSEVQSMELTSCSLMPEDVFSLASALPSTPLTTLSMSLNQISSAADWNMLLQSLPSSKLTQLSLVSNGLTSVPGLVGALKESKLQKLDLSFNPISDGESLAHALQEDPQLRELQVEGTAIDDHGATQIAQALLANSHLRKLSISNSIADQGARALLKVIARQHAHTLQEIDLSRNMLTDSSGAMAVAALMHSPPQSVKIGMRGTGHVSAE